MKERKNDLQIDATPQFLPLTMLDDWRHQPAQSTDVKRQRRHCASGMPRDKGGAGKASSSCGQVMPSHWKADDWRQAVE